LKAHRVTDRTVWVADSFAMFPLTEEQGASERSFVSPGWDAVRRVHSGAESPSAEFRARSQALWAGTSFEEVRARFARYGLLDDRVRFVPGYFRQTLPDAPIERLALLRLDGDLYDSTYDTLQALYPRVSRGGYVVVDDYGAVEECRMAVRDYLRETRVAAELVRIDGDAVFWQRRD
jgi:hypothetical protein